MKGLISAKHGEEDDYDSVGESFTKSETSGHQNLDCMIYCKRPCDVFYERYRPSKAARPVSTFLINRHLNEDGLRFMTLTSVLCSVVRVALIISVHGVINFTL